MSLFFLLLIVANFYFKSKNLKTVFKLSWIKHSKSFLIYLTGR
jgi:hypothetical protein